MKWLLLIAERILTRLLGLDYRTMADEIADLKKQMEWLKKMATRTEQKVYRAEEQTPDITHLQRELQVNLDQPETLSGGYDPFPVGSDPLGEDTWRP